MAHHNQNSASGTATLLTGTDPSLHGIIGLSWWDRAQAKEVGCTADERETTLNGKTGTPGGSPRKLLSPTVGDQLRLITNGRSQVYSVAANESTAILAAGYAGNGAFWFDDATGTMVSGSYYMPRLPEWVQQFNRNKPGREYARRNWVLLKDPEAYGASHPDRDSLELGYGKGRNVFPHVTAALVKEAGDYGPLKTTPFINLLVREFAVSLLENSQAGRDESPDLVTVAFSSLDTRNSAFGPASVEMEDLYLRLDQEIASLIGFAEEKFGKDNLLLFLTSNVPASYPPELLKGRYRYPAGVFSPEKAAALMNSFLNITYGDLRWVSHTGSHQIYLDHSLIGINKIGLEEIRSTAAAFTGQFEGIAAALPAGSIRPWDGRSPGSEIIARSFHPQRSGDVLFTLREGWQPTPGEDKPAYTADSQIPLLFWGCGIRPDTLAAPIDAIQLVPTLSQKAGIPLSQYGSRQSVAYF